MSYYGYRSDNKKLRKMRNYNVILSEVPLVSIGWRWPKRKRLGINPENSKIKKPICNKRFLIIGPVPVVFCFWGIIARTARNPVCVQYTPSLFQCDGESSGEISVRVSDSPVRFVDIGNSQPSSQIRTEKSELQTEIPPPDSPSDPKREGD